jgi:hypothetical protein
MYHFNCYMQSVVNLSLLNTKEPFSPLYCKVYIYAIELYMNQSNLS